ncbi:hypothetical protein [Terrabacter carboxydivorans]|uniref:Uncharacterized protein n=1 Tax=Terrabacter carboxydivorans TaxID=619730 RepID=A0ABP5Y091_9MICO
MTRATIIWFVGAAVVGAIAGGLHLLRSAIGGSHTGTPLAVSAYGLTLLAAAMLFHGIVVAAREQDTAAGPAPRALDERAASAPVGGYDLDDLDDADVFDGDDGDDTDGYDGYDGHDGHHGHDGRGAANRSGERSAPSEAPDVYTFRGGKPIAERAPRPARRDRPSRG